VFLIIMLKGHNTVVHNANVKLLSEWKQLYYGFYNAYPFITTALLLLLLYIQLQKFHPIMDSEQRLPGWLLSQLSACHKKFCRYYMLTPCYPWKLCSITSGRPPAAHVSLYIIILWYTHQSRPFAQTNSISNAILLGESVISYNNI